MARVNLKKEYPNMKSSLSHFVFAVFLSPLLNIWSCVWYLRSPHIAYHFIHQKLQSDRNHNEPWHHHQNLL